MSTGHVDIQDPHVYTKKRKDYPNSPNLYQDLHGEHGKQYIKAMKKDIQSLIQQSTWTTFPRS
jgi:hypothetical protein